MERHRSVYCNPSASFEGRGSFHDLGDYESIALHFVDERNGEVFDEHEQGFEAVLDVDHYGRIIRYASSDSDFDGAECQLFKREKFEMVLKDSKLDSTEKRDAVFKMLESMEIKTFIIVSGPDDDAVEIIQRIRDVIEFVSRLRRTYKQHLQCCLLFQDMDGLLYNLTLPTYTESFSSNWQACLNSFSGAQATSAIAIMSRAFPCVEDGLIQIGKPAILALMLGIGIREELSLSWLNSSLLVQGIPSTAAYSLINYAKSDWIYKAVIASLIMAELATGDTKRLLTVFGICLGCIALLANIGARVWHYLKWRPIPHSRPLGSTFSFLIAILTGVVFPHMGHRDIEAGGKAAVEAVLKNMFWVGAVFLLSDHNGFQSFLLVGTERCDQQVVDVAVGSWIAATFVFNLVVAANIKQRPRLKEDDNSMICEDQNSPVGFRILSLPEFIVDPSHAKKGFRFVSLENEIYISIFLAIFIMAGIVSMPYTAWSGAVEDYIKRIVSNILH